MNDVASKTMVIENIRDHKQLDAEEHKIQHQRR